MEKSAQIQKVKNRELKIQPIYTRSQITKGIVLPINAIGKNLKEMIEVNIKKQYEAKCIKEGYIKPNSIKIISFSNGLITNGYLIFYEVLFECEICFPVEGMLIKCVAKNITIAGITALSADDELLGGSPVYVLVPKDYHLKYNNSYFNDIKVDDKFLIRVIGQKFQLNDKYISVLGELKKEYTNNKPKLTILK
jgi:DNA-directed RNA polymerase subunit E'/Rpb7